MRLGGWDRILDLAVLFAVWVVVGCGGVTPSSGREPMPTLDPSAVASGVVAGDGTTVLRRPVSAHGLVVGVSYSYQLPRCQAEAPLDFDGSFWDPESGDDLSATAGKIGDVVLMAPDSAVFRAGDGTTLTMRRHAGQKAFAACS